MVETRLRLLCISTAAALVATVWALPVAADAGPSSTVVKCGQTLTRSVRLANDLVGCPADGLRIGADNITIDLAGHSISGMNAPGSEGIANDGHPGVHIRNGTIQTFFLNGVALRDAPHSSVTGLTIRKIGAGGGQHDASAGVLVNRSPDTAVSGDSVTNDVPAYQSDGVDVLSSSRTVLTGNRLSKNAWNGLVVLASPGARITGNTLNGNKNQGLEANAASNNVTVSRNFAAKNASNGLVIGALSAATIEHNTVTNNRQAGLFMFDLTGSLVSDNQASGNLEGIHLDGGQHGSFTNRISNNDTSSNRSAGLVLAHAANKNNIVGNVSGHNQGPPGQGGGIILSGVTGNSVLGNVAIGNRDVGIGVFQDKPGDSKHNVLTGNVAISNRNHGISAVKGTRDGGGNFARDNTPLPNCSGVSCA